MIVFVAFNEDGPATWSFDEADEPVVLFWSNEEYARICLDGPLEGYEIQTYDLVEFLEVVLTQLDEQGYWIGVNWVSDLTGLEVSPGTLHAELVDSNPQKI